MKTLLLSSRESSTYKYVIELFTKNGIECFFVESELKIKTYPTTTREYWTNPKVSSKHLTVEFTGKNGLDDIEGLNQINEMLLSISKGETLPKDSLFDVINKLSNGNAKQQVTRTQKIIERHNHDVKNGSNISLEDYQKFTTHESLRDFYINTESMNL